jgi:hypothetical protein
MTDTGPWRPHPAAFPARIGVVDVALEALGVEVHREGDRSTTHLASTSANSASFHCRWRPTSDPIHGVPAWAGGLNFIAIGANVR